MASEAPEAVVERIEAIPEGQRTKDDRRALNRAKHAIARIQAGMGPDTRPADLPPVSAPAREAEPSREPTAFEVEPCPDPLDPQASRALYASFYRRMWALAHSAKATNMDIVSGFEKAKAAAGVGREPPPPERRVLDMASILGGAEVADVDAADGVAQDETPQ